MTDEQYAQLLNQHIALMDRMTQTVLLIQNLEALLVILVFVQILGFLGVLGLAAWSVSRTVAAFSKHSTEANALFTQTQTEIRETMKLLVRAIRGARDTESKEEAPVV